MSTFEEAYDTTGHGTFNHIALLTCGFILLYVTTECLGVGYVLNRAECDLDITVTERGLIAASTLIGVVTPAIFWGYMGDEYGRRKVMLPTILATVVVSICSSMAVNFWNMFLLRLLVGLIISASCATVYVYLGELHTAKHRAPAIAWGSAFIALSYFTMPGFGWAILPHKWSLPITGDLNLVPWRVFMWAWCLWGVLAAIGLYILPESPRYLLATRGPEAVVPVLAKMYAWNHNLHVDDYPVREIISRVHEIPRLTFIESFKRMGYMIRPPLRRCVIISHACNFLVFMQSNAFYVWMPHIVNELLHSQTTLTSMCSLMNSKYSGGEHAHHQHETAECRTVAINNLMYPISMVTGVLTAIMYVSIGLVVEKFGKKVVFCSIMITCSLLILGAGLLPHAYVAIAFLIPGMCGITANTVLATVAIEVFPTSLRALALCTLFMIGRLGAAMGAHLVGMGLQANCTMVVLAMTLTTGGTSLLMLMWPNAQKIREEMEAKAFTY
ncbi:synaptic vesicle glycoprotein 2A-like [Choristoneura fumiferana]|uniref:synaptic vesicle glycoprotein 2A-like n=1 Tax=Choristoneura fumiferana TaxID=7141 RepID=UPI003D154A53